MAEHQIVTIIVEPLGDMGRMPPKSCSDEVMMIDDMG